jgi:hypothetical protein
MRERLLASEREEMEGEVVLWVRRQGRENKIKGEGHRRKGAKGERREGEGGRMKGKREREKSFYFGVGSDFSTFKFVRSFA